MACRVAELQAYQGTSQYGRIATQCAFKLSGWCTYVVSCETPEHTTPTTHYPVGVCGNHTIILPLHVHVNHS